MHAIEEFRSKLFNTIFPMKLEIAKITLHVIVRIPKRSFKTVNEDISNPNSKLLEADLQTWKF